MRNIEFWVIFVIENLIKLQKMVLERKNNSGNEFTLQPMTRDTLVILKKKKKLGR